jgi:hypothetical protein
MILEEPYVVMITMRDRHIARAGHIYQSFLSGGKSLSAHIGYTRHEDYRCNLDSFTRLPCLRLCFKGHYLGFT